MISYPNKFWYKLLKHFDENYYFQNGLTLPYIIGSRLLLEPKEELYTISEIIIDFDKSCLKINVLKCPQIGEYVFRLCESGNVNGFRKIGNFVIQDYSFIECNNVNQMINELETKYKSLLDEKKYSIIDGVWDYYCENDELKINEIA